MSQRNSEYARQPDEAYNTPPWPAQALAPFLWQRRVTHLWDPAAGAGHLVRALRAEEFRTTGTTDDFLAKNKPPRSVDCIVMNPPYGRTGRLAVRFIEHALTLTPIVAALLRIDFDSGRTRVHLFRDNPAFAQKIVLLHRIIWFEREGAAGPSENHCWAIWDQRHRGPPTIAYASNSDLKSPQTMIDEVLHGLCAAQSRIPSVDSGGIAPGAPGKLSNQKGVSDNE